MGVHVCREGERSHGTAEGTCEAVARQFAAKIFGPRGFTDRRKRRRSGDLQRDPQIRVGTFCGGRQGVQLKVEHRG